MLYLSLLGMNTTAAYKKWEKAAIAGVSLVADAAEHLERAATVKEVEHDQENPGSYHSGDSFIQSLLPLGLSRDLLLLYAYLCMFIPGEKCADPVEHVLPLPTFPQNHSVDNNMPNSMKLKLQLFPIDEPTRRALEMVWMKENQQQEASCCSNV